jgi:Type II secretory pathway, prepilin signal peptidase PulO and related peptidases
LHIQDPELTPFLALAVFLFGLAFGSFLNVVIYRLPRRLSVVSPRSACPGCGTPIAAYDNIPVLSWLLLRGRCRKCKTSISPRYLMVELLTGLIFLAMFLEFGVSWATLKFCIFAFLLLGLIFIDAEHRLLPDKLTLPGFFIGLIFTLLVSMPAALTALFHLHWPESVPLPVTLRLNSFLEALVAAGLSSGLMFAVGEIYFRLRRIEGLGFGDVKLMAMIGAFLGTKLSMFVIFAGSLLGSIFGFAVMLLIWRKRTKRWKILRKLSADAARKRAWRSVPVAYQRFQIPFGVFLGSMGIAAVFIGDPLLRWYWDLFS